VAREGGGDVIPKIVCIDDEPNVLAGIAVNLRRDFEVLQATSGADGLKLLDQHKDVTVVVSDMRMPGMTGAVVLAKAREQFPDVTRVLLTGQADMQSAISAVNDGQVFRFLTKPCARDSLLAALRAAAEHHRLVTAERVLLEHTLKGAIAALVDVLALTSPKTFGRANRIKTRTSQLATKLALEPLWQIEMAALLQQIAYITLPDDVVAKLVSGHTLSDDERKMVARMPAVTEQLLAHIPRLESVREMLAASARPPQKAAPGKEFVELAAQILRVATEVDELEQRGHRDAAVVDALRARPGMFDPRVIDALAAGEARVIEIKELKAKELKVGMVFAEDAMMSGGSLLAPRGYEISVSFLERTRNFPLGAIREPLKVVAGS
jgi:response regulator RpfG family c-di-GMP phosphodiesterase